VSYLSLKCCAAVAAAAAAAAASGSQAEEAAAQQGSVTLMTLSQRVSVCVMAAAQVLLLLR
jgi:ABC-type glycerol-3-phosphate transport system substrate-binding protein